jgi:hypothetical protein
MAKRYGTIFTAAFRYDESAWLRQCTARDLWNQTWPVGHPVWVCLERSGIRTRTEGPARIENGTVVVSVLGMGAVPLEWVRPAKKRDHE